MCFMFGRDSQRQHGCVMHARDRGAHDDGRQCFAPVVLFEVEACQPETNPERQGGQCYANNKRNGKPEW
ncbi:hypothetical protein SDC9_212018 [bioreactor metagenome]|uniref:Uncharacterized protein n=1 Tax=bioreactor metagenome TaxID=1076179 RepID=A0A645JLK5_9ZZZZ